VGTGTGKLVSTGEKVQPPENEKGLQLPLREAYAKQSGEKKTVQPKPGEDSGYCRLSPKKGDGSRKKGATASQT